MLGRRSQMIVKHVLRQNVNVPFLLCCVSSFPHKCKGFWGWGTESLRQARLRALESCASTASFLGGDNRGWRPPPPPVVQRWGHRSSKPRAHAHPKRKSLAEPAIVPGAQTTRYRHPTFPMPKSGTRDTLARRIAAATTGARAANARISAAKAGSSAARARIVAAVAGSSAAKARIRAAEAGISAAKARISAAEAKIHAAEAKIHAADAKIRAASLVACHAL